MLSLSVRTAQTTASSPIGETMTFDFSKDVPTGSQVLAYTVGLTGFMLNYETNSSFWAENLGLLQISLIPSLNGNVLSVTGNCTMTDYDGDAGMAPAKSDTDPGTMVQATAIALIGTSDPVPGTILGNVYGLGNGQSTGQINIGGNTINGAFLSGFMLAGSGGATGSISSISLEASSATPAQQEVTIGSTATTGGLGTVGTIDAMFLSTDSTVSNFQIQPASVTWNKPDGESGMTTSSLSATFDVPNGLSIVNAGLLVQSLSIVYDSDAEFQMVTAQLQNSLAPSGNTVSGTYYMNIYDPDFMAHSYIDGSSTAHLYIVAQFGTA